MAFVKSTEAHAEILDIDTSAALAQPGVVGIITAEDIPHNENKLLHLLPTKEVCQCVNIFKIDILYKISRSRDFFEK